MSVVRMQVGMPVFFDKMEEMRKTLPLLLFVFGMRRIRGI